MHQHEHHHHDGLRAAFFINFAFTLIEIVGGLATNSLAILADAAHDLGDSVSLGMAWLLDHYSHQQEDGRFSYGYRRFSLLGALINALILFGGSLWILMQAIPRLIRPEDFNSRGMLLLAVLGILVNGLAVLRLRGDGSLNARVAALHLLEDVMGWVAVLIVGIILEFTDLPILDPILSVAITLVVLYRAFGFLRQTLAVFLQAVPAGFDLDTIEARISAVEGVCSTHHTHVWSLDGEQHVLTTHVVLEADSTREQAGVVKADIKKALTNYDLAHITVEIEFGKGDCMMNPDLGLPPSAG
ncbi:MAG: cation transporter [Anaerolineales bacterium]|nr:cation transporter [Anaerolineales bacterium]